MCARARARARMCVCVCVCVLFCCVRTCSVERYDATRPTWVQKLKSCALRCVRACSRKRKKNGACGFVTFCEEKKDKNKKSDDETRCSSFLYPCACACACVRVCVTFFLGISKRSSFLSFSSLSFSSLSLSLFASFELRPRFRSSERDCGAG